MASVSIKLTDGAIYKKYRITCNISSKNSPNYTLEAILKTIGYTKWKGVLQ